MSSIVLYPANGYDFDAADVAAYNAPRTSGVYSSDEDFVVTAAGGMDVTVSAGLGWVRPERFAGYSIVKRDPDTITLPVGWLAITVVVAVAAGLLAAAVPARRASRVDVLRAISIE